jgi:Cu-Zn family superoxide dismutase
MHRMTKPWHWGFRLGGFPLVAALLLPSTGVRADDIVVPMALATQAGFGASVGTIVIGQSTEGAIFTLRLKGLPPGPHGFHLHENGECGPTTMNGIAIPAGAAGRHWDPDQTLKHAGPMGEGHLGDLPLLDIADDGTATQSLTAARIKEIAKLHGKAIVIHVHGDNYSDKPEALGGGGPRLACGVIP